MVSSQDVRWADGSKAGEADTLWDGGQEKAHRQEHDTGGACCFAWVQQAVHPQDFSR